MKIDTVLAMLPPPDLTEAAPAVMPVLTSSDWFLVTAIIAAVAVCIVLRALRGQQEPGDDAGERFARDCEAIRIQRSEPTSRRKPLRPPASDPRRRSAVPGFMAEKRRRSSLAKKANRSRRRKAA